MPGENINTEPQCEQASEPTCTRLVADGLGGSDICNRLSHTSVIERSQDCKSRRVGLFTLGALHDTERPCRKRRKCRHVKLGCRNFLRSARRAEKAVQGVTRKSLNEPRRTWSICCCIPSTKQLICVIHMGKYNHGH